MIYDRWGRKVTITGAAPYTFNGIMQWTVDYTVQTADGKAEEVKQQFVDGLRASGGIEEIAKAIAKARGEKYEPPQKQFNTRLPAVVAAMIDLIAAEYELTKKQVVVMAIHRLAADLQLGRPGQVSTIEDWVAELGDDGQDNEAPARKNGRGKAKTRT